MELECVALRYAARNHLRSSGCVPCMTVPAIMEAVSSTQAPFACASEATAGPRGAMLFWNRSMGM